MATATQTPTRTRIRPEVEYRFWHRNGYCSNDDVEQVVKVPVLGSGLVILPDVRCSICGQQCYHERIEAT